MELIDELREQFRQAVAEELPQPDPGVWLTVFQKLLATRAAPGTAALQTAMVPDLVQLARSVRFVMADDGPYLEATPPGDKVLVLLRRGGLWIRGGEVEAELLMLLGELGS